MGFIGGFTTKVGFTDCPLRSKGFVGLTGGVIGGFIDGFIDGFISDW